MSYSAFMNDGKSNRICNNTTLHYDQACLKIFTNEVLNFRTQYDDCDGCELLDRANISSENQFIIKTTSPLRYSFFSPRGDVCDGTYRFMEYGQYEINATMYSKDPCAVKMTAEPDAAYLPILTTAIILLSMATLWYIVKLIGKRFIASRFYVRYFAGEDNELGSETRILTTESSARLQPTRSRLRSLDIFRGIAVSLMIFVNMGGGGYDVFRHAAWDGLTIADLVLPWFGFAMGEALVLSLHSRLRTAVSRTAALGQVVRRSIVLFAIGVILGSTKAHWDNFRIPGVLQLLAVTYLVVGALECAFMKTNNYITQSRFSLFRDISAGWQQWLATLLIVATQIYVSLGVAAPGCPRGYRGPGGLHHSAIATNMSLQNCTGGIAGYIDRHLFGPSHMYQHGTYRKIYQTVVPHDPEGLMSALGFVLVVQAGAHSVRIMLAYNHARARIMRWVFWSVVFGVTGGGLCGLSATGGPMPLNKNLMSVSYCLVTSSLAFFIVAVLYFVVDLKNKWGGRPFYYAGQNALFLYVGSELLKHNFPLYISIAAPTHGQLLVTHAATTLVWMSVAVALHRKRVFITV